MRCATLGITGRIGWVDVPPLLENPSSSAWRWCCSQSSSSSTRSRWLDSAWDAAHTVIRPIGGALISATAPDQEIPVPVMLGVGALLALSSHSAKASARALINTSPEPVSNVAASLAEDGLVGVVMTLAIAYPRVAFVVTAVLAVGSTLAAVLLFKASRAVWRRLSAAGRVTGRPTWPDSVSRRDLARPADAERAPWPSAPTPTTSSSVRRHPRQVGGRRLRRQPPRPHRRVQGHVGFTDDLDALVARRSTSSRPRPRPLGATGEVVMLGHTDGELEARPTSARGGPRDP